VAAGASAGDRTTAARLRDETIAYLEARLPQAQYHILQAKGYPIGSGSVESAGKLLVEARLKGSGMRWARRCIAPHGMPRSRARIFRTYLTRIHVGLKLPVDTIKRCRHDPGDSVRHRPAVWTGAQRVTISRRHHAQFAQVQSGSVDSIARTRGIAGTSRIARWVLPAADVVVGKYCIPDAISILGSDRHFVFPLPTNAPENLLPFAVEPDENLVAQ
jgi:hypothetical protein